MSAKPPKDFVQKQVCCGKELEWIDCGHRAGSSCPDCASAGGWWQECERCGEQPYGDALLKPKRKRLTKRAADASSCNHNLQPIITNFDATEECTICLLRR